MARAFPRLLCLKLARIDERVGWLCIVATQWRQLCSLKLQQYGHNTVDISDVKHYIRRASTAHGGCVRLRELSCNGFQSVESVRNLESLLHACPSLVVHTQARAMSPHSISEACRMLCQLPTQLVIHDDSLFQD